MNKLQKDKNGFSVAESIIVLVVVLAIGAVGYFVYSRNHNKTPDDVGNSAPVSTDKAASTPVSEKKVADISKPVVAFMPETQFNEAEKNELQAKIIGPMWDYNKDQVASIQIESGTVKTKDTDYKYSVKAIMKDGGYEELLYGSKSKGLDYWLPICSTACKFTQEFKTKYPDLIKKYENQ